MIELGWCAKHRLLKWWYGSMLFLAGLMGLMAVSAVVYVDVGTCLLYTSPSPRD